MITKIKMKYFAFRKKRHLKKMKNKKNQNKFDRFVY